MHQAQIGRSSRCVQKFMILLSQPEVKSPAARELTAQWKAGRLHNSQLSEIANADFPKMRLFFLSTVNIEPAHAARRNPSRSASAFCILEYPLPNKWRSIWPANPYQFVLRKWSVKLKRFNRPEDWDRHSGFRFQACESIGQ